MDSRKKEIAQAGYDGVFHFKLIRDGEVIDEWNSENIVVDEGLDYSLDASLANGAQLSNWYVGLFKGNYTPLSTDTAANIASNSTELTEYTASTRVTWVPGTVASQSVSNTASVASFTANATVTAYGAFLISDNAKSGTAGKLFCASRFGAQRDLQNADILQITYQVDSSDV